MRISLSISITLREGCEPVCPGPGFYEDCIVRVGRDADPVAAEVDEVYLAVCVAAPEGRGVRVLVRVVDGCSGVGGRERALAMMTATPALNPAMVLYFSVLEPTFIASVFSYTSRAV